MATQVTGSSRRAPVIEVSALFGAFRIPGSDFTLRFASTFANAHAPHHRELLGELKPMRDRVDASALSDLTALLQRDLNDRRVATELVPYLLGRGGRAANQVGFFPAVLAVLIPRGYLQRSRAGQEEIRYPTPAAGTDEMVSYGQRERGEYAWQTEQYRIADEPQPVGILRINPRLCEVVVLDGQHRSNAFRFLAGYFDPSGEIYSTFYRDRTRPDDFDPDLPVTVVWFEAAGDARIEPRLISRQLFVDVNNSAHAVSRARTILLDDRSVTAIATQEFYNGVAARGFDAGRFSLLHAAFDMDSDLADARLPALALTSPEIVENCLLWLLLGSSGYSNLRQWRVERMRASRNRNQFAQVLGRSDGVRFGTDEDDAAVHVEGPEAAETYRGLIRERVVPVLFQLLEGLPIAQAHFEAAEATRRWAEEGDAGPTVRDTWDKVFVGGEGLYWTFSDRGRVEARNAHAVAMETIERRFREERARGLGREPTVVDAAFKSFVTKAFQVGFVMAATYLAERGEGGTTVSEAAEALTARLASFTQEQWLALFREVRPLVLRGDAQPKAWPTYRNLLVRMYDEPSDQLFEPEDLPEVFAMRQLMKPAAQRLQDESAEFPEDAEARRIVTAARDQVARAFESAGMSRAWFRGESAIADGLSALRRQFEANA